MDQLEYCRRVLKVFYQADAHEALSWYVRSSDRVVFMARVSDVFEWGTADSERIYPEQVSELELALDDLRGTRDKHRVGELFAARARATRPLTAAYPKDPAVRALFDACGPERDR